MTKKTRLETKSRSHIYDITRPRPRHGHKYTKYEMYLDVIMVICIKQHLKLNSWKVKQHWRWAEKKALLMKKKLYMDLQSHFPYTFFINRRNNLE